jgi:hypothetical protein
MVPGANVVGARLDVAAAGIALDHKVASRAIATSKNPQRLIVPRISTPP